MCIKGDGDGSNAVGDYVAQLRTELRQQPAHERRRWLFFELKNLVMKNIVGSRRWLTLLGSSNYQLRISMAEG